jgi:hypothetical protein
MKYKVYGNYGYTSECLLHETDDRTGAIRWADRYVDRGFGGYDVIEVAYFNADGEYVAIMKYRASDYEDDWTDELEEGYLYDEF